MTVKDAKKELRPIKDMEKAVIALDMEIERLETAATKMTANYAAVSNIGSPENKLEKAAVELADYRGRLSSLLIEHIKYKNRCLEKVRRIEPANLQKVLIYYYFNDFTLEKTAELLDRSYQGTYKMFTSALKKYCEISD